MRFNYHKEFGKGKYNNRNNELSEKDELEMLMQMSDHERKKAMGCIFAVLMAVSLPLIAIGAIIISCALYASADLKDEATRCTHKIAAVVDEISSEERIEEDSDGDSYKVTYYTPVLKYSYMDHEYYCSRYHTNKKNFDIGDYIDVYIDPDNPGYATIPEWNKNSTSAPKRGFICGAGFLIIGLSIPISALIVYKRKKIM